MCRNIYLLNKSTYSNEIVEDIFLKLSEEINQWKGNIHYVIKPETISQDTIGIAVVIADMKLLEDYEFMSAETYWPDLKNMIIKVIIVHGAYVKPYDIRKFQFSPMCLVHNNVEGKYTRLVSYLLKIHKYFD